MEGIDAQLVGIDVGLSFIAPTTGICRTNAPGDAFMLAHTYATRGELRIL